MDWRQAQCHEGQTADSVGGHEGPLARLDGAGDVGGHAVAPDVGCISQSDNLAQVIYHLPNCAGRLKTALFRRGVSRYQGAMTADVMIEDDRWAEAGIEALAERSCAAALAHLGHGDAGFEVAVLACDDARIAALNADFRGKPQPTNVLSWPSEERGAETPGGQPLAPEDEELGDIAISYDTCSAEALAAGKTLGDHATHLIVHGLMHLLGYDHETDADAALMEGLETEILAKLGIEDPYS